ncbi:transcription termination factor 2 [Engraulis encrasicolus]|uniref:transcription termination factor 2 n=1 Tax=Engraulis encrasicolus TaxID=184585 RepID=UPI002FD4E9A5
MMEIVRCDTHRTTCLLKTGVRDGPNKGKSFYVCAARQDTPCNFTLSADIPPSHCLHHEEAVVELQALIKSVDKHQHYRLFFRCAVGKKEGQKWCGNIPWNHKDSQKRSPLTDKHLQPSSLLPPVRNPFKAPQKSDEASDWRKMQDGQDKEAEGKSPEQENRAREQRKDGEHRHHSSSSSSRPGGERVGGEVKESGEVVEKERSSSSSSSRDKVGDEAKERGRVTEKERSSSSSGGQETWRSKPLPTGMKIKKRVSGEEEEKRKSDGKREEEEEAAGQERSEAEPSKGRSTSERKESDGALSPTSKSDTTEKIPAAKHASESKPAVKHDSSPKKDKEKKRHSAKSDSKARTRVSSNNTDTEAPRHHHSANTTNNSNPSEVEKTHKSSAAAGKPEVSTTSIPAAVDQGNRTSSGAAGKVTKDSDKKTSQVRDQPQRRSPVELSDDDEEDDDDDDEGNKTDEDDDDDDVQVVSVQPAPARKSSPVLVTTVQKTLTSYPGFLPSSSQLKGAPQEKDPRALHCQLTAQLKQKKATLSMVNVSALPDKGQRLRSQVQELEDALESLSLSPLPPPESQGEVTEGQKASPVPSPSNPFSRPGGTMMLPNAPAPFQAPQATGSPGLGYPLSQGYTQMYGVDPQSQAFYGGRMTESRMVAIRNATTETIDHLHKSLETCPGPDTQAKDPKGIKVDLLPHQKRALAWLLWREDQKPCGGILADDMGLGKTLTMIALILAQKKPSEEKDLKLEGWISKHDSSVVASQGTLIICPASLVHHWKKEVERHVKSGRLTVYLYHGPNRHKNAKVLAEYDIVVTTYSLVSKEIPVQKGEGDRPSQDAEPVGANLPPLLRVAWARVVLDEAHNIKNPKVQTSMAVCKLRARARWAVTGTPIQNNLLDMYSLLKFLRCAPFDEYKLWKAQVDNGSRRGGERLNILTQTLLLRRTKDQQDSSGKPLVALPDRSCEVHRVKLSEDEQSVYDVVFARSKSTLQSYLRRHEGKDGPKGDSSSNPFDKVASEFGMSQQGAPLSSSQQDQQSSSQASSTVHILSLLLRLRQSCCHLSLLKKTLDQSELQGDGIALSLEEQLNALCLSESSQPSEDLKDTVCLNGSRFRAEIFEEARGSTKLSAVLTELKEIRSKNQKSVIVSQWTSMLRIVAVHLKEMGLSFAVIDGTVNIKHRMDLVEEFNTNPKGPQVMLVSLCAGGVGLNLIGGNHLFLMDMHWNPALEDQACDRIYRVGQHRDVTIHKFICEGTVEDKISSLQERKKELAQRVLTGTGSSSFTKLSLADLRVIFGV